MTTTSARSVCDRIARRLAESVGARRYSIWFDRTAKFAYDDQHRRLDVAVPNRFVADWIGRNFGENLRHAVDREVGEGIDLRVQVNAELFDGVALAPAIAAGFPATAADAALGAPPASGSPVTTGPALRGRRNGSDHHAGIGSAHGRQPATLRHRLEDFITGPSNELALAAAVRVAEDEQATAHTLFLHGGCGLGKTHLLQGICARVLERNPHARVHYSTGEQFTNEFLVAVRSNRIEPFRKRIRALDLLAVDDVHFLANKQATQQEFLHSFDSLELGGARVALASDCHPKLIRQFSEALVSRCIRGMVVEIAPPDTATRAAIVRALARRRGIPLLDTVVEVIASRCVGSVRELEGTLAKLHALAFLNQQRRTGAGQNGLGLEARQSDLGLEACDLRSETAASPRDHESQASSPRPQASSLTIVHPIGHTLVNHLFDSEASAAPRRAVRFEHVLAVVTEQLSVTKPQILSGGRHQRVVLARSLVAYLARQLTPMSYPEIAAALGRKNHSTIITAAQRLEKLLPANPTVVLPTTLEQLPLGELVERFKRAIVRA